MATASEPALYLDSSAIVKLIVEEEHSNALVQTVAGRGLVSSELALAEVPRAIQRVTVGRRAEPQRALRLGVEKVLSAMALVPLDRRLLVHAGSFNVATLRTLDAIHIASALAVMEDIEAFISYDQRQVDFVEHAGLPVIQPS